MTKILVLEGGFNEEHEISLITSKEIKKTLTNLQIDFESIEVDPKTFLKKLSKYNNDYLCFNALHGTFGEDGSIQKILEENQFKYTHANSTASRIAFDKNLAKETIKHTKILTLDSLILDKNQLDKNKLLEIYQKYESFVIKPVSSGSSYGVILVTTLKDVKNLLENLKSVLNIYKNHNSLMIERYVKGRELTVAVIEREKESEAVEVTEILSKNSFFDYEAKYTKGFSKHILPANLPNSVYEICLEYSKIAHDTINCRGVSRSDFIYDNEKIYFLEINSQPGLTPISLVPEQLEYRNINFDSLIKNIINSAL